VHALTDVTGFGLLGHALELARGAKCRRASPWMPCRCCRRCSNWRKRQHHGRLGPQLAGLRRASGAGRQPQRHRQGHLTDPQTAGPLLVACAPEAVEQVLAIFRAEGFADATVIGDVLEGSTGVSVI
jgi:selenide,water dikinase